MSHDKHAKSAKEESGPMFAASQEKDARADLKEALKSAGVETGQVEAGFLDGLFSLLTGPLGQIVKRALIEWLSKQQPTPTAGT